VTATGLKTKFMLVDGDGSLTGRPPRKHITAEVVLRMIMDKVYNNNFNNNNKQSSLLLLYGNRLPKSLFIQNFYYFSLKHLKNALHWTNTTGLPILSSHYSDENVKRGIEPVYYQIKYMSDDDKVRR
jgi:hypothetical protein